MGVKKNGITVFKAVHYCFCLDRPGYPSVHDGPDYYCPTHGIVWWLRTNQRDVEQVQTITMPIIILVAIIILLEKLTGKTAQQLVIWLLSKIWYGIKIFVLYFFFHQKPEPAGERT